MSDSTHHMTKYWQHKLKKGGFVLAQSWRMMSNLAEKVQWQRERQLVTLVHSWEVERDV